MLDLISIGDVTEDVFVQVDEAANLACDPKNQHCVLEFEFPTKLGISKVSKLIGGNAGNVAIGSSRLKLRSALYAEVGKDTQGDRIYNSLKDNNVVTTYFKRNRNEKTNYSVVLYYNVERTILVHHEKRRYSFPKFQKSRFIFLTSAATGSEKLFSPLLQYLKRTKAQLGFNPGTHQMNLGLKKLKPIFKQTHALFVNLEEAQKILKTNKRDLPFLLKSFHALGIKVPVISDGPNGAYLYDGTTFFYCPIYDVPTLERTGCGDSFATGFMAALANNQQVEQAMRWGTLNSASVIQRVGPQDGLITKARLQRILKANPKFQPRAFNSKEVTKNNAYKPIKYKKW